MTDLSKTGETKLLNGRTVSKNSPEIHLIGAVDELNSHLGLVKALLNDDNRQFMEETQKNLMKLMSHVSDTKNEKYFFTEEENIRLEKETEKLTAALPKRAQFVIPGRNVIEAQIHIARTIARRAERLFTAVNENDLLCPNTGVYLNKLSGYLFVLAASL